MYVRYKYHKHKVVSYYNRQIMIINSLSLKWSKQKKIITNQVITNIINIKIINNKIKIRKKIIIIKDTGWLLY